MESSLFSYLIMETLKRNLTFLLKRSCDANGTGVSKVHRKDGANCSPIMMQNMETFKLDFSTFKELRRKRHQYKQSTIAGKGHRIMVVLP